MVLATLLATVLLFTGHSAWELETKEGQGPTDCVIETNSDNCIGNFKVKNENYTLQIIYNPETLKNCPPTGKESVTVFSNSPGCQTYQFIFRNNSNRPTTAFPRDGTLPCPLIGFDIGCGNCGDGPYTVGKNTCLCNNDCFRAKSWEECASQCLGVTGTQNYPNRGNYDGWSYQSRGNGGVGNQCCCKNIQNGNFYGSTYFSSLSVFGDRWCLGSGANSL